MDEINKLNTNTTKSKRKILYKTISTQNLNQTAATNFEKEMNKIFGGKDTTHFFN